MSIKRILGAMAVLVLIAVTAGLVAVAVHRHSDAVTPTPRSTSGGGANLPAPSTPVDAKGLEAVSDSALPLLSVANRSYGLFGVGGCTTKPLVGVVNDGGKKSSFVAPPARHVMRLVANTTSQVFAIGADAKCRLTRYDTADGGLTWNAARAIGAVWTPTRSGVRGPSGAIGHPCGKADPEPVALAVGAVRRAIVICRVGVFTTRTGPTGWQPAGKLLSGQPASVTLRPNGSGVLLLANQGYCLGLRVMRTSDDGRSWTPGRCLARSHAPAAVSINAKGYGLLLSTGQQYSTTDGGATWVRFKQQK